MHVCALIKVTVTVSVDGKESGASCRSRAGTFASLLCLCALIGLLCRSYYEHAALHGRIIAESLRFTGE